MSDAEKAHPPTPAQLVDAVSRGDVPTLYANGFAIGLTNADVVVVLSRSNRPVQVLHMSYTLAKTLHTKLAAVVQEFEEGVDRNLLTTDDVDQLIQKKGRT